MGRIAPVIELSDRDRETLASLTRSGKTEQRLVLRARIVLAASRGAINRDIARELSTREATVSKWRSRYHKAGLKVLQDEPRSGKPPEYTQSTDKSILAVLDERPPGGFMPPGQVRCFPKSWESPSTMSGVSCASTRSL